MKKYKLTVAQEKWLQALESGKYKKAKGKLHKKKGNKHSFCCLGVACDLYNKTANVKLKTDYNRDYGEISYDGEADILPYKVAKYLKLSSGSGDFEKDNGEHSALTELNDGNWSHKKIAAFIRKNPELFFE